MSSAEGWVAVMFSGMDVTDVHEQPKQNYSADNAMFFVAYLAIVQIIIFSLLVAIIIDRFNTVSGKGILTEKQRDFKQVTQAILTEPKPLPLEAPDREDERVRWWCYMVLTWTYYDVCVFIMLFTNAVLLTLPYYGMSDAYGDSLDLAVHSLAFIFVLELGIRLKATGFGFFVEDPWNKFDGVVVLAMAAFSIVSLVIGLSALSGASAVRLVLLIRLVNRYAASVRTILVTVGISIPPIFAVLSLILLVFFIYAILGMTFFANVRYGIALNSTYNFESFDRAMLTLLRMITGEAWTDIMHDCMIRPPHCTVGDAVYPFGYGKRAGDCGDIPIAYLYFISFYFLGEFFLMSLFVAVIVDCFQSCNATKSFGMDEQTFEHYGTVWHEFTRTSAPPYKWLHIYQLHDFLLALGPPLGLPLLTTLNGDTSAGLDCADSQKFKRIYSQVLLSMGTQTMLPNSSRTTQSIGYRKLQWLLTLESNTDDDDALPYAEVVTREEDNKRIRAVLALSKMVARWKGRRVRDRLAAGRLVPSGVRRLLKYTMSRGWNKWRECTGYPLVVLRLPAHLRVDRPGYSSEFQAHIATTELQPDACAYPWPADAQTTEEAHAFIADVHTMKEAPICEVDAGTDDTLTIELNEGFEQTNGNVEGAEVLEAAESSSEQDSTFTRHVESVVTELFDDYDLDGSGSINAYEELLQLSTNVTNINTRIAEYKYQRDVLVCGSCSSYLPNATTPHITQQLKHTLVKRIPSRMDISTKRVFTIARLSNDRAVSAHDWLGRCCFSCS